PGHGLKFRRPHLHPGESSECVASRAPAARPDHRHSFPLARMIRRPALNDLRTDTGRISASDRDAALVHLTPGYSSAAPRRGGFPKKIEEDSVLGRLRKIRSMKPPTPPLP